MSLYLRIYKSMFNVGRPEKYTEEKKKVIFDKFTSFILTIFSHFLTILQQVIQ